MMASITTEYKREQAHQAVRMARRSRILQNLSLVWLDANIDETNDDYKNSLHHLYNIVPSIEIFKDVMECMEYIDTIKEVKIFMIVAGYFGQQIVSKIHGSEQLDSIYVFCGNTKVHEQWSQNWLKVKGVYTDIKPICEKLRNDRVRCDQDAIEIRFIGIDPSFMYTQLLKESLINMGDDNQQQATKKLVSYCADSANIPEAVTELFAKQYNAQNAIWWYTGEFFLYPMLNRALRTLDIDTILAMGFFIRHLHQQLEYEQKLQTIGSKPFKVYRGQGLSQNNFQKLQNTEHGLISFNNFLSTSLDKNVSVGFAERALVDANNVGILFVMQIEPAHSGSTPFAQLDHLSYFKDTEKEILFSTHTIFQVDKIEQILNQRTERLWQVELSLTDESHNQLKELTENIRHELEGLDKWDRLGRILIKSGQSGKAAELYELLLESARTNEDKALYHNQLGWVYEDMGEYSKALEFYETARGFREKGLVVHYPDLAQSYNNIGQVYSKIGEYAKALEYYEKALSIREKHLPSNDPQLAVSYNCIGYVYSDMTEYSKALHFYEKALVIRESLPANHPDLAQSYNKVGLVYSKLRKYSKALEFYEKARLIRERSLPSNHPQLAASYNCIGFVHSDMGEYSKALQFYEKARIIREKSLPPNHPDLAQSYNCIGYVHSKIGDYSKVIEFYEKARFIREKSLPADHQQLASSYNNIGQAYSKMAQYSKALEFYEKTFSIREKKLPANHPRLATLYNSIGFMYWKMEDYSKALEFYEKARLIREDSLPENHHDLAKSYNNIGKVYRAIGDFEKAILNLERAEDIARKNLPNSQLDLKDILENIEFVRKLL